MFQIGRKHWILIDKTLNQSTEWYFESSAKELYEFKKYLGRDVEYEKIKYKFGFLWRIKE
jgi:hypothetical protein